MYPYNYPYMRTHGNWVMILNSKIRPTAFHPKASNDSNHTGRSSDLFSLRRLPGHTHNQWRRMPQHVPVFIKRGIKLTATGIVPELHRIPF